ncbi:MAG TPA: VWA domain-containing protein, partial [Gemmataceae bacterium]|nr:VWA domain-containing protein [Gemmataceae bacterium]
MRILLAIALVLLLVAVVPGAAQNTEPLHYQIDIDKDERGENKVFASSRERNGKQALYVTVHFRVRHASDGQDADVDKADIVVREDGRKVHDLEFFSPRTALTTVLAMDISGSMENTSGASGMRKIDESKKAAGIFLDNLSAKSETGLVLFDHLIRVQEPPWREAGRYAEHRSQIRRLIEEARPMGGTAYLDAAIRSVDMLKNIPGRRAVVLMTDGVDMNSKRTVGDVIKLATVNQVPIYTLGIGELGKYKNVTTVLVLDHSGSMKEKADASDQRSKIEALRTAASRFVELMRRDAKTTLQPFSSDVDDVPSNFTDDKQFMIQRIKELQ